MDLFSGKGTMRTIWKYQLEIEGRAVVKMPKDAEILSVQLQHHKPTLWAIVDPDAEKEERTIVIFGTGHPMPDSMAGLHFLGTVQTRGGGLVWHIFEDRS